MKSFPDSILHPVTEDVASVEVFYRIADVGVIQANVRATIVKVMDGPENILAMLDSDVIRHMEDEAYGHAQDERDRTRFGTEEI